MVHNLAVADQDLKTSDLAGGEAGTLDVSSLAAGEYEIFCDIAGHKDAGMVGTLTVGEGGGSAEGETAGHGGHGAEMTDEEAAALDQAMMDSMAAYPAETEGVGNQQIGRAHV